MFQGQPSRSDNWLYLDLDWIEDNFTTREPELYKRIFKRNIEGKNGIELPKFSSVIGNTKETGEMDFIFLPQYRNINRTIKIVVVSVFYPMNYIRLENLLLVAT